MPLFAKFKKILRRRFRATLNNDSSLYSFGQQDKNRSGYVTSSAFLTVLSSFAQKDFEEVQGSCIQTSQS